MSVEDRIREEMSIPKYYQTFIDKNVNLAEISGSIPCKIHNEKHGSSFSYSKTKKVCTCFGKCHKTWDVIGLHETWYKLGSREEAIEALASMLHIPMDRVELKRHEVKTNYYKVELATLINRCNALAKDLSAIEELDFIMSQYKTDGEMIQELKNYIERHGR